MQRSRVINAFGAVDDRARCWSSCWSPSSCTAPGSRSLAMVVLFVLMQGIRRTTTGCATSCAVDEDEDADAARRGCTRSCWSPSCTSRRCGRSPTRGRPGPTTLEALTVNVDPDETRALQAEWDAPRHPGAAEGPRLAVPRDHPPGHRLRAQRPRAAARATSSPSSSPSTSSGTGGSSCCTTRARCGSRAGCCSPRASWSPACRGSCSSSEGARGPARRPPRRVRPRRSLRQRRRRRPRAAPDGAPASLVGTSFEVEVGPVAHGGHCVARHDGRVVFVRHALPGERVRVRRHRGRRGDRVPARPTRSRCSTPSPDRVAAAVPVRRARALRRLRLAARRLADQRAAQGRRRARAARTGWPALDVRRRRSSRCPATPTGCGWRTRVEFAVDADGPAGPAPAPLPRRRAGRRLPDRRPARSSAAGVLERRVAGRRARSTSVAAGRRRAGAVARRRVRAGTAPAADGRRSGSTRGGWSGEFRRRRRRVLAGAPRRRRDAASAPSSTRSAPRPGERGARPVRGVGPVRRRPWPTRVGAGGRGAGRRGRRPGAWRDARRNLHDLPQVECAHGRVDRVLRPLARQAIRADLVVLDPPRTGAGRDGRSRGVAALAPRRDRLRRLRPGGAGPRRRDARRRAATGWPVCGRSTCSR